MSRLRMVTPMSRSKGIVIAILLIAVVAAFALYRSMPSRAEAEARRAREQAAARGFVIVPPDPGRVLSPGDAERGIQLAGAAPDRFIPPGLHIDAANFDRALFPGAHGGKITIAASELRPSPNIPGPLSMQYAGRGVATRGWISGDGWESLAAALKNNAARLDGARAIVLEERPLRFALTTNGTRLLRPHLTTLKPVAQALSARASLATREGRHDDAWQDVMAVNAMAARYEPDPFETSHLVRCRLVEVAFATTWEALQSHARSDASLADLDRLWRGADLFAGIEEVPKWCAADLLRTCAEYRDEYRTNDFIRRELPGLLAAVRISPIHAWKGLIAVAREALRQTDYVRSGGYRDEIEIIRFYEKQFETLRRARAAESWSAARDLPGIASFTSLQLDGGRNSPLQSVIHMDAILRAGQVHFGGGSAQTFFACCMEAETRRRILLAAIAVERTKLRLGRLPATLDEAGSVPPDAMTGGAFQYRRKGDSYVIYSLGLDLSDNSGTSRYAVGSHEDDGSDIVWPRPATEDEADEALGSRRPEPAPGFYRLETPSASPP